MSDVPRRLVKKPHIMDIGLARFCTPTNGSTSALPADRHATRYPETLPVAANASVE
jgi:hypothetical protein